MQFGLDDIVLQDSADKSGNKSDALRIVAGVPPVTMPGHTGYLTFATLPPAFVRRSQKDA